MSRKKPVHLIGNSLTITPCGLDYEFHVIKANMRTKGVTCKKCKKTNWFKDVRKAARDD